MPRQMWTLTQADASFLIDHSITAARAMGVALPQTAGVAQLMHVCASHGLAEMDHSAVVRALEIMADHQVAD